MYDGPYEPSKLERRVRRYETLRRAAEFADYDDSTHRLAGTLLRGHLVHRLGSWRGA